jgi:hypothetical protein
LLLLQLRHEQLLRLFPGDRLILTRPALTRQLQRGLNAIRVIEHLQPRLAARARAAHADRMFRVPLDLLRLDRLDSALLAIDGTNRFPLHHADSNAAARGALLAQCADPGFLTGHEAVFGDEQGNDLLRVAASIEDEAGGPGDAAGFEEVSPFHL